MQTTMETETLTDGSKVYAVVFVDAQSIAKINCYDERSARALQIAFADCVCDATIDPV